MEDEAVDLASVIRIAEGAGRRILEVYRGEADIELEHKADDSPLTLADRRAHDYIEAQLNALTPELPVLSEESNLLPYAERREWTRYWLVDPLDGTKEFISRNGEFTVNIALIENGVAILGVVHVPVSGVTYSGLCDEAVTGSNSAGAWKSEGSISQEITVAAVGQRQLKVVASRRHKGERLESLLSAIAAGQGLDEVVSIGSSLKMCLVAEGKADLYPRLAPTCEWDTAAAQAIVVAAGGELVDLNFEPLRYNQKESLLNPEFVVFGDSLFAWRELFESVK